MNPDAPVSWVIEPARAEELASSLRLIFGHLKRDDREIRLSNALELIRQKELDPAGVLVGRRGRTLLGATICQLVPGASGLIWPPQTEKRTSNRLQIEDQLVQAASQWLRRHGAKLGQSLLAAEETH